MEDIMMIVEKAVTQMDNMNILESILLMIGALALAGSYALPKAVKYYDLLRCALTAVGLFGVLNSIVGARLAIFIMVMAGCAHAACRLYKWASERLAQKRGK